MTNPNHTDKMQSTNTTTDLIQKIHKLPPELFENIYDHYTTYSSPKTVVINESYTFPAEFRVNRSIRQSYAENYFSKTTFICFDADTLENWLSAIPLGHQRLIKQVNYSPYEDEVFDTRDGSRRLNMAISNARPAMNRSAFALLRHELFEKIHDFVGTVDTNDKEVNTSYNPPYQLPVDRKSRVGFAKDYYSNTFIDTNSRTINLWLDLLPTEHKVSIKRILNPNQGGGDFWRRYVEHCESLEVHFHEDRCRRDGWGRGTGKCSLGSSVRVECAIQM
ncbi:hypothetical protein AC579_5405 [Pseudocercospora musae]|uniref:F-box domain-containing protein n=1 Tax=Pseudocercospora musae TaxID=113226 RepID=A0A139IDW9_9PEZI|nr:hypothetical protein AC579_5405 [Pseudocercospora musae]